MKVIVNRDNCIGCGCCEAIYPEVFQIDDEGISTVICEDFSNIDEEKINDAVESCPTSAIIKADEEKINDATESCPTSANDKEE